MHETLNTFCFSCTPSTSWEEKWTRRANKLTEVCIWKINTCHGWLWK